MTVTQEFLVLRSNGLITVLGVGQLPTGTVVGGEAERLRLVGQVWVKIPLTEMTPDQWEAWIGQLRSVGFSVSVEPFWTTTPSGSYQPLEKVRDELSRHAR